MRHLLAPLLILATAGMAITPPALTIPAEGRSASWKAVFHSQSGAFVDSLKGRSHDSVATVKDSILSCSLDSSGWARVEVLERVDGQYGQYSCRIFRGSPDSTRGCPVTAKSWVRDTGEQDVNGFWVLGDSHSTPNEAIELMTSNSTSWHRIRRDGILDSSYSSGNWRWYRNNDEGSWSELWVLLEEDGIQIRSQDVLGIHGEKPKSRSEDLIRMASRHPDALLRWRDLAGRTGTFRAGDLVKTSSNPRLLVLDASFPDGSRWQGKFLTGGGR